MKYVVKLKKTLERIVIVDAVDEDECDKKMQDVKQWEWSTNDEVTSSDDYCGYQYVSYESCDGIGGNALVKSVDELAENLGTTVDYLDRDMFKYTNCGMSINWNDKSVTLTGYVEGADCDGPSETLYFPFSMKEFNDTVDYLDKAAEELWHEWNDD